MIKIILVIGHINYDVFLERVLEMAKEHPEQMGGMKLPPFTAKMLKLLPARKKNEMVAQAINGSKEKLLPQLEMMLSRFLGFIRLKDLEIHCGKDGQDEVTVTAEFAEYDSNYLIDNLLPLYYSEQTARQVLGENYGGSYELNAVQYYMKQQDFKQRQLLLARSMSANKQYLMQMLERGANMNSIELKMNNIRFMVK